MLVPPRFFSRLMGCLIMWPAAVVLAQNPGFNYDESKVPPYMLPDPLVMQNGQKVTDATMWRNQRRPELLKLFETEMFGRSPAKPEKMLFEVAEVDTQALRGKATRKEVTIWLTGKKEGPSISLLMYLPRSQKPVPAVLGLNFNGNQTVHADPGITLNTNWASTNPAKGIENNKATEKSRGVDASQWQVETVVSRGYALCTIYYGDIDPDFDDGFKNGIHPSFYRAGQTKPEPDEWGSIAAWAWGLSRALDYLETDQAIDPQHVAVIGHSRLGKAALWAGATDERFALVISNNSGCGGAALNKRIFGETVGRITKVFPHWFCGNFTKYGEHEADLPLDAHELLALIAPRPLYVASASEDLWADPRGEFLGCYHADPVYKLLGTPGLGVANDTQPEIDKPVNPGVIGYHLRTGKHDVLLYDWQQYLDFADRHFGHAKP